MTPPTLAYATARQRLAQHGVSMQEADCSISWFGPAAVGEGHPGSEATVQAMAGLMHLHRREGGGPRRLGIEVASLAAGVLAANAALATMVGRSRGRQVGAVHTSVLQAALLQGSHQVAAATCPQEWLPAAPGPAPGPPFASADGQWFEIETFDPEAWKVFWCKLGGDHLELGRAWTLFRSRYYRGTCPLPHGFHEATLAHDMAHLADVAEACAITMCRVRSCGEALANPGLAARHPVLTPFGARRDGVTPKIEAATTGLPLEGIRVVESTTRMQGPMAGLLLAMLGAHVVKVEPPGGDVGRGVPPLADDIGSFFLCMNRGKESVEIDLSVPSGRAALVELAVGADVFLHNWRPGKAQEWGLDHDALAGHNPRLIYTEASGWGGHPDTEGLIGTDFPVQAFCGMGESLSPADEPPAPSRALLTDFMGALVACEGVLGALYRREQDGRGYRVNTSLMAGAMTLQSHVLEALADGTEQGRYRGRPQWQLLDRPLAVADGWLAVTIEGERDLDLLAEACGVAAGGAVSTTHEATAHALAASGAQDWQETLVHAGLAASVVATDMGALPADPRLAGMFEPLAADSVAPATPWHFAPLHTLDPLSSPAPVLYPVHTSSLEGGP